MLENPTIVSYLTIFAAIIAPVLTALITQIGAYKTKTTDIYFSAKVAAYTEFINIISEIKFADNAIELASLRKIADKARLFSPVDVSNKIDDYINITNIFIVKVSANKADYKLIKKQLAAESDVINALQADLQRYNKTSFLPRVTKKKS